LPKALFPALAVNPLNLVPACAVCNHTKRKARPTRAEEQTFHPYFDDFGPGQWLHAEVFHGAPTGLVYRVVAPATWSALSRDRAEHHFQAFELASLYASYSAEELLDIRQLLLDLGRSGGPDEVRRHLGGEAVSRRAADLNSWRAAMYEALITDAWFWEGGYTKIGEG
jgi:hypothetical protein